MIFHRILSDFLIQTGLTQNSSLAASASADVMDKYLRQSTAVSSKSSNNMSGDALRWDRKKLEVNPRIRFNHRGQVAMALPLEESSNSANASGDNAEQTAMLRYQFFVTLDEAPFLDAKHVVFGTVAGSTMFNALRIGRTDADEQTGIPTDLEDAPPRIKCVKIDYHPFDDLVVTAEKKIPWKKTAIMDDDGGAGRERANGQQSTIEKRRKKRSGKRDFNVLSFGDEERDYDAITSSSKNSTSMKSSHDILAGESSFLSSKVDAVVENRSKHKDIEVNQMSTKITSLRNAEEAISEQNEAHDTKHEGQDRTQIRFTDKTSSKREDRSDEQNIMKEGERLSKRRKTSNSKKTSEVEARRSKYVKSAIVSASSSKKGRQRREDDTMAKLLAFKTKVLQTKGSKINEKVIKESSNDDSLAARMANRVKQDEDEQDMRNKEEEAFISMPGYSGQVYDDQADTGGDWMSAKFKCKQHADHVTRTLDKIGNYSQDEIGGDGRRMDDYVVFDEKNRGREKNGHRKRHRHH